MVREDAIVDRLIRRAGLRMRVYHIMHIFFLVNFAVLAASAAYAWFVVPQQASPVIAVAGLVSGCLFWPTYFVMTWFTGWSNTDLAKRLQRVIDTLAGLKKLKEEHPELLLLNKVTELLEDEKAQITTSRNFWVGIAVNFVFTLLGFALSYAATKLGWLR